MPTADRLSALQRPSVPNALPSWRVGCLRCLPRGLWRWGSHAVARCCHFSISGRKGVPHFERVQRLQHANVRTSSLYGQASGFMRNNKLVWLGRVHASVRQRYTDAYPIGDNIAELRRCGMSHPRGARGLQYADV